jgi:hypothetical protein
LGSIPALVYFHGPPSAKSKSALYREASDARRDMRISLEQAKHFVFLGYRLPEDDLIYRSLLAAHRYSPKDPDPPYCSVVGYEEGLPAAWIKVGTAEYEKYRENTMKNHTANSSRDIFDTVKQLQDIFEHVKIRIYGQIMKKIQDCEEVDVEKDCYFRD